MLYFPSVSDCPVSSEIICDFFRSVNIPEHSNIFVTVGEYDPISNFEMVIEAFYQLLYCYITEKNLMQVTFLIILGDELVMNNEQKNYYKKLEGIVLQNGLEKNVYFLKISPHISKLLLMKVSLAVIFSNVCGCYNKFVFLQNV